MHFAQPQFLWLLLLLPLLAAGWLLGRRRVAVAYPDLRALKGLPRGAAPWVEALGLGLRLAIIGLLIAALARPRWPDEGTRIPAQSNAIQMVLDISGSMAERDFMLDGRTVSRLDAAKHAFRQFIHGDADGLPGRGDDLVGLVTFAAWPEDVYPPTLSHSLVLRMLDEAKPPEDDPRDTTTNIGDALVQGAGLLQRSKPEHKVLILLSDGEHNVPAEINPHAWKPRQAAQIARGLGIRVYTVYVGQGGQSEDSKKAEEALRDVAEITGGRSFEAHDTQGLLDVCREIDQLEPSRIESFQYYRYHEAYPWVGLTCLVLLVGVGVVEGSRWLRVP